MRSTRSFQGGNPGEIREFAVGSLPSVTKLLPESEPSVYRELAGGYGFTSGSGFACEPSHRACVAGLVWVRKRPFDLSATPFPQTMHVFTTGAGILTTARTPSARS